MNFQAEIKQYKWRAGEDTHIERNSRDKSKEVIKDRTGLKDRQ